jgi:quercetin dioxygenase-like cupin family protein
MMAQESKGGSMTARATSKVFIDNERVRVTEWRFPPGAATGWHRHEMDYVVVPLLDGELELVGPDGERTRAKLSKGTPYFRHAGVEHDVINANAFEFAFVEIELK